MKEKILDEVTFYETILGSNFTPSTSCPPPKPAPPSFPNSPVTAGISPIKASPSVVGASIASSVPSIPASAVGKKLRLTFRLEKHYGNTHTHTTDVRYRVLCICVSIDLAVVHLIRKASCTGYFDGTINAIGFTNQGIPSVASVAPLNTNPMPLAAFNMTQALPTQPLCTGMVAPPGVTGIHTVVPPIGSINTGTY